jgi:hypothetical protein
MEALEAVMKKHNISIDSTSSSSSHGHALSTFGLLQLLLLMSGLLIMEHLIIWLRTKTYFLL